MPLFDSLRRARLARTSRSSCARALAVLLIALAPVGAAYADDDDDDTYAIGLWGDLPYNDVQAQIGVPNLIADMNAQRLKFTVHDGDLKGGNGIANSVTPTTCSDALYIQALGFFNALNAPAIFTPGDNDWTDCDRASNGSFSSRERLDHERAVLFNTPYSFGKRRLRQEVQSTPLCLGVNGPVPCVENRRWSVGNVTYVTLNVQGSCNNLCDTAPDPAEFAARNAANIAWLMETFRFAAARQSSAVMIIAQGNPGWDLTDGTRAPLRDPKTLVEKTATGADASPDGYVDFLRVLRDEVVAFRRPVAYVHGDSHYFRVDKPLLNATGQRVENFTRVETFGDNAGNGTNDVNWIKVTVNARSREVFSYQPMVVPGNRVAVPAP
jgi:hypothetical protein